VRHPLRAVFISVLLAGLLFHPPLRAAAVAVVRFPFLLAKSLVVSVVNLPRLPSLQRTNEQLQAALIEERAETARLRELVRQSQQADALLTAHGRPQGVLAHVIGRSTLPTQHTILLDAGRRQGVAETSVIVDAAGVVGRVTEAGPATALVLLLTDPNSRVAALVERSREAGLLVGRGGGACEFIYLDVDADIQDGDRIVTAGLGGVFPKGLLLGTVTHVSRDEQSWSSSGSVKPAATLNRLEDVLCLIGAGP